MNHDCCPAHDRAATLAFDKQPTSTRLDTSQTATERKPEKTSATSLLFRFLYWIYERRLLVSSNRVRCRTTLASSWMEIAAMLASGA
jgi:hypothetical protein